MRRPLLVRRGETAWNAERRLQGSGGARDPATVLVVIHGGPIRRALDLLVGLSPPRLVPAPTGSLTVLELEAAARLRGYGLSPAPGGARPPPP